MELDTIAQGEAPGGLALTLPGGGEQLLGVAVGAIMTSAMALIADLFDDAERGRILGYQAAAMSFGGMSFIMAGGFLADLHWRGPFAVYLAPRLLIPFILAWVPCGPPADKMPETRAPKGRFPWAFTAMICVAAFANFFTYFTIPLKLPFMLRDIGLDRAEIERRSAYRETIESRR